jgi:transposase InsO family protein
LILPARQIPPAGEPGAWLPVAEAARLTGLSVSTWQRKARKLEGQGLARRELPREGRGRPTWYVHRCCDRRLTDNPKREARNARQQASLASRYSQRQREAANLKAKWVCRYMDERRRYGETELQCAERILAEAYREDGLPAAPRTLQLWTKRYHTLGPDGQILGVEGLIDKRSNDQASREAEGQATGTRSQEAIEYFYGLYRTEQALPVRTCHEMTLGEAKRQGWAWPETYSATTKWLRDNDDLSLSYLAREGHNKWARRYLPHNEYNEESIQPGFRGVCDHTQMDLWVCDAPGGKPYRPWLTAILDRRSRRVMGWHLGKTPHQDAILAALRMTFRECCVPVQLHIDNGKDFTSKVITGLTKSEIRILRQEHGRDWKQIVRRDRELVGMDEACWGGIAHELGIELIYAIPYSPWSKGVVERWFGTMHGQFARTFETYCGNRPDRRPEHLNKLLTDGVGIPTLDELRGQLADYLVEYHHRSHTGAGMNGRSPLEVWQTAERLRRADDDALSLLMKIRGAYKVGANGVRLQIGGASMTYGAGVPMLRRYVGRKVLVAVDPDDVSRVWAYSQDGDGRRLLGCLPANDRIPLDTSADNLREANRAVTNQRKAYKSVLASASRRSATAAEELRRKRAQHAAQLRATGTTDSVPAPNIVPVPTGFEGFSKPVPGRPRVRQEADIERLREDLYRESIRRQQEEREAAEAQAEERMEMIDLMYHGSLDDPGEAGTEAIDLADLYETGGADHGPDT